MDFSSALANLQKSASRAAANENNTNETNSSEPQHGGGGRGGGSYHHETRDRPYNPSGGRYSSRGGGGRGGGGGYRGGGGRGRGRGRGRHHNSHYNDHRRSEEIDDARRLPQLVSAIPKYKPVVPISVMKKNQRRHVAILFLTIRDLPFEHIWRKWLTTTNENLKKSDQPLVVSILCHAKFPDDVKSPWLKQRLLLAKPPLNNNNRNQQGNNRHGNFEYPVRYHTRRPEWGSVEITEAMIDLLDEALRIGSKRDHYSKDERYSTSRFVISDGEHQEPSTSSSIENDASTHSNTSGTSHHRHHSSRSKTLSTTGDIPTVDRFIFASETCMPVTTLAEMELALFGPLDSILAQQKFQSKKSSNPSKDSSTDNATSADLQKSWINAQNTPNNGYARQLQWDSTHNAIPKSYIWKADQWIMLTRRHAWPIISLIEEAASSVQKKEREIIQQRNHHNHRGGGRNRGPSIPFLALWQCFRHVKASDEIYFPTAMALLGILGSASAAASLEEKASDTNPTTSTAESTPNNNNTNTSEGETKEYESEIVKRRVTYCDWSMNAKNPATIPIARHEQNFREFRDVVKLAREEGCLFARKFQDSFISQQPPAITTAAVSSSSVSEDGQNGKEENDDKTKEEESKYSITGEEWLSIITKCK